MQIATFCWYHCRHLWFGRCQLDRSDLYFAVFRLLYRFPELKRMLIFRILQCTDLEVLPLGMHYFPYLPGIVQCAFA